MTGNTFQFLWEIRLIEFIQSILNNNEILKKFFVAVTFCGEAYFSVLVIGFLYWGYDKTLGLRTGLTVLSGQLFGNQIKNIFRRMRPYMVNETVECFKAPESKYDMYDVAKQGYSFPSGHASNISSTVTSVYLKIKDRFLLIAGSILTLLVMISRFALGVHYPTDVIVGLISGVSISILVDYLFKKFDKKYVYTGIVLFGLFGLIFSRTDDYFSVYGLTLGFIGAGLLDDKYIHFENTNNFFKAILRTIGGGIVFLGVSDLLKLPITALNLDANFVTHVIFRIIRYGLCTFISMGVYPYLFRYKLFK